MAGKRSIPEINASSMADIAFLLLIFFLMVTEIEVDKGILHKLPRWVPEDEEIEVDLHDRNVLEILANANDQLFVENEYVKIEKLQELTIKHLTNNGKDPRYADSPDDAIVSLKNDRGTSYGFYIQIQDELKGAYRIVRDDVALGVTGGLYTYTELQQCMEAEENDAKKLQCKDWRDEVRELIPMKISEAEPEDIGG